MDKIQQIKPAKKLFKHREWQECYERYRQALFARSQSHDSVRSADSVLPYFFADPNKRPDQYTSRDVEDFINAPFIGKRVRNTPPAPRTRNLRLGILKSFYAYAQRYTVLFRGKPVPLFRAINPTAGIKNSKFEDYYRAFDPEELQKFFAAIPRDTLIGLRDRALFLFYLYSARRRTEVLNLQWGDLRERTFEDDRGRLYKGWAYRWKGKGHVGKDDETELPPQVMEALRDYLEDSERWGSMQPGEYVFCGLLNYGGSVTRPITRYLANTRFKIYRLAANLPPDLTIHSFRYTHACDLYESNNHDLMKVKERLRHKHLNTTEGYLRRRKKPKSEKLPEKMAAQYAALR